MSIKFHYEHRGTMRFGPIYRPIARVSFYSTRWKIWIETWMVVDTGADFSILPQHMAKNLGISLQKDCVKEVTIGVGGQQTIYLCKEKIEAKLGNMTREVPMAFFDSDKVPPILGRCGFLETFDVEFLKKHVVKFKG